MDVGINTAKKIYLKRHMHQLMQDFIEQHQLGHKLAERKLGTTPKYLVIEELEEVYRLGRTGIQIVKIKFNSEHGSFQGSIAIKEFETIEKALQQVEINKWIRQRVFSNKIIKTPDIFIAGDRFIVYEGIAGETFEKSTVPLDIKLNLAGEALATFHSASTNPVDEKRYDTLLEKLIKSLPIDKKRKSRLTSLGVSLFRNYYKEKAGITGYGDFHPGNLMIHDSGAWAYLIDPEFVETTVASDRFEDIANFFIFDISQEFLETGAITRTINAINKFLQSYNNYILFQGVNLNSIYQHTYWIGLYFQLGLVSLLKGIIATESVFGYDDNDNDNDNDNDIKSERAMNDVITSYRLTKEIWLMGAKLLPAHAFPSPVQQNFTRGGWLLTWASLYEILWEQLKTHPVFTIVFDFPEPEKNELSIQKAFSYWHFKKKQSLEKTIQVLHEWISIPLVTLEKKKLSRHSTWMTNLGFKNKSGQTWEEKSRILFNLLLKDPMFAILNYLVKVKVIHTKQLEDLQLVPENKLKTAMDQLKSREIITYHHKTISLSLNWKDKFNLPSNFEFNIF